MREAGAVAKNTVLILIASGMDALSSLAVALIAARYLGPEGFGEFAFIRAYGLVASPLIAWGVWSVLIRDVAKDKSQTGPLLVSSLYLTLFGALLVMGGSLAGLASFGFVSPQWRPDFVVGLSSQAILAAEGSLGAVLVAHNRVKFQTLSIAGGRILQAVLCLLVALAGLPHVMLFWAQALSSALAVALVLGYAHLRVARLSPAFDPARTWKLFRESFSVGMATLLTLGYTFVSVFVLKGSQSMVQLAYFQAGQRLVTSLMTAIRSFMTAAAPVLARLAGNREEFGRLVEAFVKYIAVMTAPVSIFLFVEAPELLRLLYGPDYVEGATGLRIMAFIPTLLFTNRLMETALISVGRQRLLMFGSLGALAVGSAVSLVLVPRLGGTGGAWAYAASGATVCLFSCVFIRDNYCVLNAIKAAAGPFACALAALAGPSLLFPGLALGWFIPLGLAYLAFLAAFRVARPGEIRFLIDLVRRRPRPGMGNVS